MPEPGIGKITNAEKFQEVFGKSFFWLLFKVSYSSLMKWASTPYEEPTDLELINSLPAADVQPVVRCKDCKHFHLDYFGKVNGVNIIVAHEICDLWAGGCRTTQDTFCSNGERMDGEDDG